jgi:hypothetical protein
MSSSDLPAGTKVSGEHERDSADLARFGYKQELKRGLGLFSSFAVAFSYISPSTYSSGPGRWWRSASSSSR